MAANRYGVKPLSLAALNGNAAITEALLKAGADANTANNEGETALMTASRSGSLEVVKSLLAHKADPNAKEKWLQETALMWAAAENHAEVVAALLGAGATWIQKSWVTRYPDPRRYPESGGRILIPPRRMDRFECSRCGRPGRLEGRSQGARRKRRESDLQDPPGAPPWSWR